MKRSVFLIAVLFGMVHPVTNCACFANKSLKHICVKYNRDFSESVIMDFGSRCFIEQVLLFKVPPISFALGKIHR